ncbi:Uncharacterised protein [Escherichia coli]|nr:Uncharacterised protein [Escherichia coli]
MKGIEVETPASLDLTRAAEPPRVSWRVFYL